MKERRIPRPLGTTYQSIQLNQEKEETKKRTYLKQIQRRMIEQYVANGLRLNGQQIPIAQFASFLKLTTIELIKAMNEEMNKVSKFFDSDEGRQLARVAFLGAIFEAQETMAISKSQTQLLLASQGQEYVPFLSSSVNQAIANQITAQKPMLELIKLLLDGGSKETNILIQNTQNNQSNNQFITPDMAVKMLTEHSVKSLLPASNAIGQTYEDIEQEAANLGTELPEVRAQFQDLTKIGIRHDGTQNPS